MNSEQNPNEALFGHGTHNYCNAAHRLFKQYFLHYGSFVNIAARLPSAEHEDVASFFLAANDDQHNTLPHGDRKYSACNLWDGFDYPAFPL